MELADKPMAQAIIAARGGDAEGVESLEFVPTGDGDFVIGVSRPGSEPSYITPDGSNNRLWPQRFSENEAGKVAGAVDWLKRNVPNMDSDSINQFLANNFNGDGLAEEEPGTQYSQDPAAQAVLSKNPLEIPKGDTQGISGTPEGFGNAAYARQASQGAREVIDSAASSAWEGILDFYGNHTPQSGGSQRAIPDHVSSRDDLSDEQKARLPDPTATVEDESLTVTESDTVASDTQPEQTQEPPEVEATQEPPPSSDTEPAPTESQVKKAAKRFSANDFSNLSKGEKHFLAAVMARGGNMQAAQNLASGGTFSESGEQLQYKADALNFKYDQLAQQQMQYENTVRTKALELFQKQAELNLKGQEQLAKQRGDRIKAATSGLGNMVLKDNGKGDMVKDPQRGEYITSGFKTWLETTDNQGIQRLLTEQGGENRLASMLATMATIANRQFPYLHSSTLDPRSLAEYVHIQYENGGVAFAGMQGYPELVRTVVDSAVANGIDPKQAVGAVTHSLVSELSSARLTPNSKEEQAFKKDLIGKTMLEMTQ
ncbi:hypothetical protein ACPV5S_15680 [Vibrio astriarenae]